jgi:hypothetical protein
MLSSQGKWQFMLLVGCWNDRLLALGRNFLTPFFQLTIVRNHYTECSPPLHSILQKGLLFRVRTNQHISPLSHRTAGSFCYSVLEMNVTAKWVNISAVLSRVLRTHEECRDMLLNIGACNSGACTAAWECVLCYQGGCHTDDNRCQCVL